MGRGFFCWLTSPFPSLIVADNFDYLLNLIKQYKINYEKTWFWTYAFAT